MNKKRICISFLGAISLTVTTIVYAHPLLVDIGVLNCEWQFDLLFYTIYFIAIFIWLYNGEKN